MPETVKFSSQVDAMIGPEQTAIFPPFQAFFGKIFAFFLHNSFFQYNFAPQNTIGALVQLVRMPACHAGGRWFESCTHRTGSDAKSIAPCCFLPIRQGDASNRAFECSGDRGGLMRWPGTKKMALANSRPVVPSRIKLL